MIKTELYGTDIETFGIDVRGRIWILQTPDVWSENTVAYRIDALPEDVEPIEDAALEELLETIGHAVPTDWNFRFLYQKELNT